MTITGNNAIDALRAGQVASTQNGTLDQNAFLKLMTTQLKTQDPFAPVDNAQMVAQMAQFSALAGTSRSTVSHFTISTGLPRRNPAIMNSSTSGGAGTIAEKVNAGSVPIATATSSRDPFMLPRAT